MERRGVERREEWGGKGRGGEERDGAGEGREEGRGRRGEGGGEGRRGGRGGEGRGGGGGEEEGGGEEGRLTHPMCAGWLRQRT